MAGAACLLLLLRSHTATSQFDASAAIRSRRLQITDSQFTIIGRGFCTNTAGNAANLGEERVPNLSLQECQQRCLDKPLQDPQDQCTGIEFRTQNGDCELHRIILGPNVQEDPNEVCMRRIATTSSTTTIATTTVASGDTSVDINRGGGVAGQEAAPMDISTPWLVVIIVCCFFLCCCLACLFWCRHERKAGKDPVAEIKAAGNKIVATVKAAKFKQMADGQAGEQKPREISQPEMVMMPGGAIVFQHKKKKEEVEEGEWQEMTDTTSGQVYYYNTKTGQSRWDKPS